MHLSLQASMSHNQTTTIEDVVADQAVQEGGDALAELRRLPLELLQRLGQAVAAHESRAMAADR